MKKTNTSETKKNNDIFYALVDMVTKLISRQHLYPDNGPCLSNSCCCQGLPGNIKRGRAVEARQKDSQWSGMEKEKPRHAHALTIRLGQSLVLELLIFQPEATAWCTRFPKRRRSLAPVPTPSLSQSRTFTHSFTLPNHCASSVFQLLHNDHWALLLNDIETESSGIFSSLLSQSVPSASLDTRAAKGREHGWAACSMLVARQTQQPLVG